MEASAKPVLTTTPTADLVARIRCDTANERAAVLELCERMELYEWAESHRLSIDSWGGQWLASSVYVRAMGKTPLDAIRAAKERSGE